MFFEEVFPLRVFVLALVFLLLAVVPLVQAVIRGYDRQFLPPGPLSAWQVGLSPDRSEEVTVWGQTFRLPADAWATAMRDAGPYLHRLVEAGTCVERWAGELPGCGSLLRSNSKK